MDKKIDYCLIPTRVLESTTLGSVEKILYGVIFSVCLNGKDFKCCLTNKQLQKYIPLKHITIEKAMAKLVDSGFVYKNFVYKPGSQELERRELVVDEIFNNIRMECD